MSTQPDLSKLTTLVQACAYDANALANGNKSAATQLRKKLSQIAKETATLRAQALAYQKQIPTRSRAKKVAPEPEQYEEPQPEDIEEVPPQLELQREMTSGTNVPSASEVVPRKPSAHKPRRRAGPA